MTIIDPRLVERARGIDMLAFLERHCGFTFVLRGGSYRCRQHPSLAVKDDRLSWYWHSKGVGGYGAIDYLMKTEGMTFRRAVDAAMNIPAVTPNLQKPQPERTLVLPERASLPYTRLPDYLCNHRGIDIGIVNALLDEGSIYEDKRGNVVFLGFDGQGAARFASLRGTHGSQRFRMDCAGSDKRYGFCFGSTLSERLYVFESPIDAMSHASLMYTESDGKATWEHDCRLSLAGTADTALPFFLNQHRSIKQLVLCLDNDPAGREAATVITGKYAARGFLSRIELPQGKDYNLDLLHSKK